MNITIYEHTMEKLLINECHIGLVKDRVARSRNFFKGIFVL